MVKSLMALYKLLLVVNYLKSVCRYHPRYNSKSYYINILQKIRTQYVSNY
jgi:hypothetical protein